MKLLAKDGIYRKLYETQFRTILELESADTKNSQKNS